MKIAHLDTNQQVIVVAEIGNNHEGSFENARKMLHLAAEAGADIVKFQTYKTELFINPQQEERFRKLKSFQLSFAEFERLSKEASAAGVVFMSTPFDLESAAFLNALVPAFKIGSCENNFFPLLELVASFEKPMVVSTGLADLSEIKRFSKFIRDQWQSRNAECELALLHCISLYPAQPEDLNLRVIPTLRNEICCEVGFSDHSLGIDAALAAVALGARIVEKHFTLDKQFSSFRDHQLSADPDDMKRLVASIREISKMLGSENKTVGPKELSQLPLVRRSIVAKHALRKGHVLSQNDFAWTRPVVGIAPGEESKLIGRLLNSDIQQGGALTTGDVD